MLNTVKSLLRDLAAQGNLASVQKYNVPPQSQQRWALQQKEKDADEAFREALALKELLTDLLARNGLLSGMDTASGVISFAKQADGEVAQILGAQHHTQVQDHLAQVHPTPHAIGAESFVAMVAWIVLAIYKLKKKSEDG